MDQLRALVRDYLEAEKQKLGNSEFRDQKRRELREQLEQVLVDGSDEDKKVALELLAAMRIKGGRKGKFIADI